LIFSSPSYFALATARAFSASIFSCSSFSAYNLAASASSASFFALTVASSVSIFNLSA